MHYFKKYYFHPFKNAIFKWREFLLTLVIELVFISLVVMIFLFAIGQIEKSTASLGDNELEDRIIFLANVQNYNSELSSFLASVYWMSALMLFSFYILYSISRYLIWKTILKAHIKFKRALLTDGIVLLISFFILVICVNMIRPEYYFYFLLFFLVPLLYYSFFLHDSLTGSSLPKVFKSALSFKMILQLPHTVLALLVCLFLWANLGYIGVAFSFIILVFFRIYATEVGRQFNFN